MKSATLLGLVSIFTISCASVGRLDLDVAPPMQSESIFVIGISSPNLKIDVFPGKMVDGKFQMSQLRPAAIAATPTNGYIVGKSKGDDLLAITAIAIVKDSNTIVGDRYLPRDDAKTLVFRASPGHVIYWGDVDLKYENNKINIAYKKNIDAAKKYIDDTYGNLKGRLEFQQPDFLPTTNTSTPTGPNGPIYVYVPVPHH